MRLLLLPAILVWFWSSDVAAQSWDNGAPCSSQHNMKPDEATYGFGINGVEPPYHLSVLDINGRKIRTYIPGEKYTIRLTGTVYFRSFLIQARLTTRQGFIIGHLRAGKFIEDQTEWFKYGVRMQNCNQQQMNNSITATNFKKKFVVEVDWISEVNVGPVQFFVTIMQEQRSFWKAWKPRTGFLFPSRLQRAQKPLKIAQPPPPPTTTSSPPPTEPTSPKPKPVAVDTQQPEEQGKVLVLGLPTAQDLGPPPQSETANEKPDQVPPGLEQEQLPEQIPDRAPEPSQVVQPVPQQPQPTRTEPDDLAQTRIGEDGQPTTTIQFTTTEKTTTATDPREKELLPEVLASKHKPTITRAVLDPRTNRIINFEHVITNYCNSNPCEHGASCINIIEHDTYQCLCDQQYTGKNCENRNNCHEHECANGGICINGKDTYHCECIGEWAGTLCDRNCPSYLCKNGGTCYIDEGNTGAFGCTCPPGWTGIKCETEINECASEPCQNGGKCVDKLNGYECECADGYMGATCHRPCQDVYKSCRRWEKEGRCAAMRQKTDFFEANCGVTCDYCKMVNSTIRTDKPLPPVLEPFAGLIGQWYSNYTGNRRHPSNFPPESGGYEEYLTFAVAEVPMFGTPSLNYTSLAISHADPNDRMIVNGFLTLNSRAPKDRPEQVALLTTSNDGLVIVEEGTFENRSLLTLRIKYAIKNPRSVSNMDPLDSAQRIYVLKDRYLQETVNRVRTEGGKNLFTKYFSRIA